MNAEIIAVGSELLSGAQTNTNAQYISKQLSTVGIEVSRQIAVADDGDAIKTAVAEALGRSNIIVMTGGLGPTQDDMTKQAVCELLSLKLVIDEDSLNKIEDHFFKKGEEMAENNIQQAAVPENCTVLKNDVGLSPGCVLKSGNQCIIMLPGPPYEMEPMFENSVIPFLRKMTGVHYITQTVNVFGMSESLIASALDDIISKKSPVVATYASRGQTDICITAMSSDEASAKRDVEITVEEIKRRLGDSVYGVDEPSLWHEVVRLLVSKKITVATAESCTGGLLSKKITDISGASLCFGFGVTSYSEDMKNAVLGVKSETLSQHGAVSAETACQMAVGAMNCAGSDMGVAITGYAGPAAAVGEPVGLVFVAVCNKETVWVKRCELAPSGHETREHIREIATLHAFDMIRRVVNGAPIFNSQRLPVSEIANSVQSEEQFGGNLLFKTEEKRQALKDEEYVPMQGDNSFKAKLVRFGFNLIPNRNDSGPEKVRKSAFLAASVALLISLCYISSFFMGISNNASVYKKLDKLKDKKPTTEALENLPEDYNEDFALLYQKNEDFAGWIEIADTKLNYPVVQGDDNDYYLNHNFHGKKDRHGVPFIDYRNDFENLDFNTIIHGHNMKSDNQMFSELENYCKGKDALTYYRKHPTINFDTVYENMEWKIFAIFTCNVDVNNPINGEVFEYYNMINPASNEEFYNFISQVRNRSIYNIPVDVQISDKILTLSTCYYEFDGQRLVVMARKVREGESSVVDVNSATQNKNSGTIENSSKPADVGIPSVDANQSDMDLSSADAQDMSNQPKPPTQDELDANPNYRPGNTGTSSKITSTSSNISSAQTSSDKSSTSQVSSKTESKNESSSSEIKKEESSSSKTESKKEETSSKTESVEEESSQVQEISSAAESQNQENSQPQQSDTELISSDSDLQETSTSQA